MPPEPNSFLEMWHAALAVLGAAAIWAWNFVTGDIRKLRETTVTKDTFKEYSDRAQKQRDELRESVIALHNGQKALDQKMNEQTIQLINAIHEVKK